MWAEKNNVETFDVPALHNNKFYEEALKNKESIANSTEALSEGVPQTTTKKSGPLKALVDLIPQNIFNALSGNGSMLQIISYNFV